jgi:hypothetical protein
MGRWDRTVSVNVDVDVDMSDLETEDLVEELEERWGRLTPEQKKKVAPYYTEGWEPTNLDHKMKFELFLKHIDDFKFTGLERRLTAKEVEITEENGGDLNVIIL